tara:strand:+ start:70 stop:240 length:171 start_codon:yes stop_codon:yes gene_type:complete
MYIGLDWLGFWVFLSVAIICDAWVFTRGYDSFFYSHKTLAEKEIQKSKIKKDKGVL